MVLKLRLKNNVGFEQVSSTDEDIEVFRGACWHIYRVPLLWQRVNSGQSVVLVVVFVYYWFHCS